MPIKVFFYIKVIQLLACAFCDLRLFSKFRSTWDSIKHQPVPAAALFTAFNSMSFVIRLGKCCDFYGIWGGGWLLLFPLVCNMTLCQVLLGRWVQRTIFFWLLKFLQPYQIFWSYMRTVWNEENYKNVQKHFFSHHVTGKFNLKTFSVIHSNLAFLPSFFTIKKQLPQDIPKIMDMICFVKICS